MEFNDLLRAQDIDPDTVLVFRHRPPQLAFRKVLPWLAAERHDVYNAYQRTHGPKVEGALPKASHVASFIGHVAGKALFIGLYRRGDWRMVTHQEHYSDPINQELKAQGIIEERDSFLQFDLERTDFYSEWSGKLVIAWPPPERSWWRWAARNTMLIDAIHETSALTAHMPAWDRIVLSWAELAVLPSKWKAALAEWRGIYLIFDTSDGRAYVGSAYGGENILGRWLNYAASGDGGNVGLADRDPSSFRFSILQRVSPDMESDEVITLEASWKDRLHTREFGLNRN